MSAEASVSPRRDLGTLKDEPRARLRAKKACKVCNSRRVRCNVMEEQPCQNCRTAGLPCELTKSRRGKYDRHANRNGRPVGSKGPLAQETSGHNLIEESEINTHSTPSSNAQRAGSEIGATSTATSPVLHQSPGSQYSGKDISLQAQDSTVFLGESNSISLVHANDSSSVTNPRSSDRANLQYPIPDDVSLKTSTAPFEIRRKTARIEYLTRTGAFSFPSNEICEALLEGYFSWFHPCFPILDRQKFFSSYLEKTISPLLLQAVLFVGATHCNQSALSRLGFPDRQEARNNLFNHAKDIYDADYETDKIIVTQTLFLMSFWRAGPLAGERYASLAWCSNFISPDQGDAPIVRDVQSSAALGLPTRIREGDCDIELLEMSDFEDDQSSLAYPNFLGSQKREHILYAIQMAKLAIYLGRIVLREFAVVKRPQMDSERAKLKEDLMKWESELSPELHVSITADSFWASMLHLAYNNLYILLFRSAYLEAKQGSEEDVGNVALRAACRNTRIIEDVLAQDLVQHSNVQITTSLFNSLCIHTICIRRSKGTARKLAEHRAQLCLLGLRELQKTWDVTNWVLQLFLQFLDQSTARRLQVISETDDGTGPQSTLGSPRVAPVDPGLDNAHPLSHGYASTRSDVLSNQGITQGLDLSSHFFASKEAEDFSMFQLQPDLFNEDLFGGSLDQYYSSILPNGDSHFQ